MQFLNCTRVWCDRPNLLKQIEEGLRRSPITLLLGPRQCGKTSLARQFLGRPDCYGFDLENYLHRSRLEDNPMGTLAGLRGRVIIDEVQTLPTLFPLLRVLADRPDYPARFLLLGSASPSLVRHAGETLAGRNFHIEMAGFSASEVHADEQPSQRERLWLRGGFPLSFLAETHGDSLKWRRDFVSDFLQRDLPALAGTRLTPAQLRRLLLLLASQNGRAFNASEIGRDVGVDFKTVQRYFEVLEGAYLVRTVPAFAANVAKRVRKAPKLYFRDAGLLHALLGIETMEQLETSGRMGLSWEGFCLEHLIREGNIPGEDCFHYTVQSGAELDLVVVHEGRTIGFEIKHDAVPRIVPSMRTAAADLDLVRTFVVYPGEDTFALDPEERFIALAWKDVARWAAARWSLWTQSPASP